jgi:hypothetical protein
MIRNVANLLVPSSRLVTLEMYGRQKPGERFRRSRGLKKLWSELRDVDGYLVVM